MGNQSGSSEQAMAFLTVFLAFECTPVDPSIPLACDNSESVGSVTDDSKPSALSCNNRRVCRQPGGYLSFSRQQQRPRYQLCRRGTLSPLCIASPESRKQHRTIDTLRRCSDRGRSDAQAHTKIIIRKFLLKAFQLCVRKFALTKISRYTVIEIIIRYQSSVQNGGRRLQYCTHCQDGKLRMSICTQSIYLATHSASHSNRNTM